MATTEEDRRKGMELLPKATMGLWILALVMLMGDTDRPFRKAGWWGVGLMLVPGLFYAYGLGWATAKTMPRVLWLPTLLIGCAIAFKTGEFIAVQITRGG